MGKCAPLPVGSDALGPRASMRPPKSATANSLGNQGRIQGGGPTQGQVAPNFDGQNVPTPLILGSTNNLFCQASRKIIIQGAGRIGSNFRGSRKSHY